MFKCFVNKDESKTPSKSDKLTGCEKDAANACLKETRWCDNGNF